MELSNNTNCVWRGIETQSDADSFMDEFSGLHDGCIRELSIVGDYFVAEDLSMRCAYEPDLRCRMIIQRQWEPCSTVELYFEGITLFSLASPKNQDRIIFEATLVVHGEQIIWSPDDGYKFESHDLTSSVIIAKRLSWRPIENGLGSQLVLFSEAKLPKPETDFP